jgi:tyrosinase
MATLHRFILLALGCLIHLSQAQYMTYNYGFDVNPHVRRQMPQRMVVRGDSGERQQVRLELRQLERDQELWTLYILGLSMLQYTDQSSPTSWYSIAGLLCRIPPLASYQYHEGLLMKLLLLGIHGIPHQTWGGVGPTPGNEDTGYCTHSSVLFPTWHRPYLVLYEVM